MTSIDIVGGVYTERCAFPYWDELFGSAGRAAVALTDKGLHLKLHTLLAPKERDLAAAVFASRGLEVSVGDRDAPISFDYLHCLSVPRVHPRRSQGGFPKPISADIIIKFGMLEADPVVHAKDWCVYDPQSAFAPKFFSASGSTAGRLAVITNRSEILKMTTALDVAGAVKQIFDTDHAEVIVVKDGLNGATVYWADQKVTVSAYRTDSVFTIGSGDVFVAAFAYAWAVVGQAPADAARYASLATAEYVETRYLPMPKPSEVREDREPVVLAGGNIYLAGPFREVGQRMLIDDALEQLSALKMKVFSPIHDIGPGEAEAVVEKDLNAIQQCDAVFAILNGSSPGTVFEVGYARALSKPVFCVAQNLRHGDLKLPRGSGAYLNNDYVSALFAIAWRST